MTNDFYEHMSKALAPLTKEISALTKQNKDCTLQKYAHQTLTHAMRDVQLKTYESIRGYARL